MARSALMVGTSDGTRLVGQRWTTDGDAKAAIVLAHGMGEHSLRYDALGKDLSAAGYDLLAVDHRGHGRTAGIAGTALGDFGDAGWDGVVADYALTVRSTVGERPDLPVIALGHSMGSWIVQQYLLDHAADVAGGVLSGSGALDLLATAVDPSADVDLSAFNAPFAPARTDYDWLSRDEKSAAGMWAAADRMASPSVPSGFPLLVLAGTADPVNAGLTALEPLVERYRAAGADVATHYYTDARHEVFNETNRDEVVADLVSWLDGVAAR
ncbi:MAG: alpha/beta hydrolase [Pseudonocardia sp. SCN 72-86]|nr:MAG: alpha/beta hydrolase [Pseudonocardia sp. SCN 72-86]